MVIIIKEKVDDLLPTKNLWLAIIEENPWKIDIYLETNLLQVLPHHFEHSQQS